MKVYTGPYLRENIYGKLFRGKCLLANIYGKVFLDKIVMENYSRENSHGKICTGKCSRENGHGEIFTGKYSRGNTHGGMLTVEYPRGNIQGGMIRGRPSELAAPSGIRVQATHLLLLATQLLQYVARICDRKCLYSSCLKGCFPFGACTKIFTELAGRGDEGDWWDS